MLATEFAERGTGVRVNAICPGLFPSVRLFSPKGSGSNNAGHVGAAL